MRSCSAEFCRNGVDWQVPWARTCTFLFFSARALCLFALFVLRALHSLRSLLFEDFAIAPFLLRVLQERSAEALSSSLATLQQVSSYRCCSLSHVLAVVCSSHIVDTILWRSCPLIWQFLLLLVKFCLNLLRGCGSLSRIFVCDLIFDLALLLSICYVNSSKRFMLFVCAPYPDERAGCTFAKATP